MSFTRSLDDGVTRSNRLLLALGGGFRTSVFPQLIAHPTDATQLYAVWPDNPAGAYNWAESHCRWYGYR